ncbi:MAG: helix-turn-helix domain-containing protein [Zestosphaera sp.]
MTYASELSKVGLRVYAYLVESDAPRGVREIARALEIPVSSVYYHLKRLEELGLIGRSGDGYVVTRIIALEGFIFLGRRLVPRLLVYSLFFLGILLGEIYLIVLTGVVTPDRLIALVSCLSAFLIFLIEGLNVRIRLKTS